MVNEHRKPDSFDYFLAACLGLVAAIGICVILGWHTHTRALVQIIPGAISMQYNTALCFVLLGGSMALAVLSIVPRAFTVLCTSVVGLAGAVVGFQYIAGISLGIDTMFFYPWDDTLLAYPGRMALTTSISFCIIGLTAAAYVLRPRTLIALVIGHTLPLSFGLTSLLGYLFGITYVLPYQLGSQMAVHTALGFTLYSAAMLAFAWRRIPETHDGLPRWGPAIAVVIAPVFFIAFGSVSRSDSVVSVGMQAVFTLVGTALLGFAIHKLKNAAMVYKGLILTAIPLLFVLGFVVLVNQQTKQGENTQKMAMHSREFITHIHALTENLNEAESSIRGFMITAEKTYLGRYEYLVQSVPTELRVLQTLAAGNERRAAAVIRLKAKADDRMASLALTKQLLDDGETIPAIEKILGGKQLMDEFRSQKDALLAEEERLDTVSRQAVQDSWERFDRLLVAATSADLLLAFTLAFIFTRGIGRRLETLTRNAQSLAEGKQLGARLHGTDEIARLDETFHSMAGALRQAHDHLEQKVQERTRELSDASAEITNLNANLEQQLRLLRQNEYKLRTLFKSMTEAVVQVNNQEEIEFINDRFCEMTGYEHDELIGKRSLELMFDDENRKFVEEVNRHRLNGVSSQYELRLIKKSGEMLWVIVGGSPVFDDDGSVTGSMAVLTDITERKRIEEQLIHDAFHDGLTGLANRSLFMHHLQAASVRTRRHPDSIFAVLFLDFDRFKLINDSLGHGQGDDLLMLIAERLNSSMRPGDIIARLGGDEFVILITDLNGESDALRIVERIQQDLKKPFDLSGRKVFTSASIGIALSGPTHNNNPEEMLRDADTAMYRAKERGAGLFQVFDPSMHQNALEQLKLETELRRALERNEFCLHYQPIVDLETHFLVGFEALVRWNSPERGLVPPFQFIPAAEESGLILPLGRWILQESCRQLREWQVENPGTASSLVISVNLSSKQFVQADLAEQVTGILAETGLSPHCLKLEITESHVMENSASAIAMLDRLRALGVDISIDDFGTGYSSLSYLHRLPVNYLKIDRSFVMRMSESAENGEIVSTIIKLAQNLKLHAIAEGIETPEQLKQLRSLGCEFGQGYHFAKPLDVDAAARFIRNGNQIPPHDRRNVELSLIS